MMDSNIFISYSREDGEVFARKLHQALKKQGFKPWMDKLGGIKPSAKWDKEIEKAIENADTLIFVMTPGSVISNNCHDEWSYALTHDKTVLPVHVIKSKIPMRLHRLQYIDFITQDFDVGFYQLAQKLTDSGSNLNDPTDSKAQGDQSNTAMAEQYPPPLIALAKRLNLMRDAYPEWLVIPYSRGVIGTATLQDAPEHTQTIAPLLTAKTPITQKQYQRFVLLKKYHVPYDDEDFTDYAWDKSQRQFPVGMEQHPVVLITYSDAQAYVQWLNDEISNELSQLEGNWRVTLPSEIEWEIAVRGASSQQYPWGKGLPSPQLCNMDGAYQGTTPVTKFPDSKSPFGVLDAIGNVWEWTRSAYDPYPYNAEDGREEDNDTPRVLRGGSWKPYILPEALHPSFRHVEKQDYRDDSIGFRPVIVRID